MEINRKIESLKLIWEYVDEWQKTKQEILTRSYEMVLADSLNEEVLRNRWYLVFYSL